MGAVPDETESLDCRHDNRARPCDKTEHGVTDKKTGDWLAPLATALSFVACYGTLAAIGLLGALGVTIALNEAVWAGAIVLFAGLTFAVLLVCRRRHGRLFPTALAGVGFLLIGFSMLVSYNQLIEFGGFVFLCAGTVLDSRSGRSKREPVHGNR
jgi:hypothetical protein